MDTNMPGMDQNTSPQMPKKKKFPLGIVIAIAASIFAGAVITLAILVFVFGMHISFLPSNVFNAPGVVKDALEETNLGNLLDNQEVAEESYAVADVYETGEDAFGSFYRAAENAPKDYSVAFKDAPIVVDWLPHASVVSKTKAEEIYKDIYPKYFLDKETLQAEAENMYEDSTNIYDFHLYQVGTIASPTYMFGTPVYIFSYPVGGMGVGVWGDYVIYAKNIHAFLALDSSETSRIWGFSTEILDMNNYMKGVISFDTGLTYPDTIDVPQSDEVLMNTGALIEANSSPFSNYSAQENAGGILNLATENIVRGYPKEAIEFVDQESGRDVYYLDGAYQVMLEDGSVQTYDVFPPILTQPEEKPRGTLYDVLGYTANVSWNDGFSESVNMYMLGGELRASGCGAGIKIHTNIVDAAPWFVASDLAQVGTAANGDGVYVMAHPEDVQIYKDLFDFGGQAAFMQAHPDMDFAEFEKVSEAERYQEFLDNDPIIFWKDHKDRWRMYFKSEYQSLAECGKPVIYLYPEQAMDVNVQVAPNGGFTYTDPVYPEKGWFVHATPKGELYSYNEKANYPYLFWEGHADGFGFSDNGFVFSRKTLESDMIDLLAKTGLNKQETADFLEFWLPKMEEKPYVFVTFANQRAFESVAPLTVTPRPDSVLRVFMSFEPLDAYKKVEPLALTGFERKGFTVVEWGGVL
ncbi:MAG: hypothetical protein COY70_00205, partial [Candidatus Magasanikbacteria bacterium CG_4_10_14_0_8_um_filter_42_12]